MSTAPEKTIAIIGGGWAGLAAAIELSQSNYAVTLFESSPQLGGRARSINWHGLSLDNGQHLMIGAYQTLLQLLDKIQQDSAHLFHRLPHRMLMLDATDHSLAFDLELPNYPAPLHLLFGVLNNRQLGWFEKFSLLIRFNRLLNKPIINDIPVTTWLASAKLPQTYVDTVLKPVCLAALTTHPGQASARAFQSVLQQTFNAPADFTDLLIPKHDLSSVFPAVARDFLLQQGVKIYTRSKLKSIRVENGSVSGIEVNDQQLSFDEYILATPPAVSASLLADIADSEAISKNIGQLEYEPIATLYLKFALPVTLPAPMIGIVNATAEWVFERSLNDQPELLAVVISAHGKLELSKDVLTQTIHEDLIRLFPGLPALLDSKLIIEKRATIRCHPGVDNLRPDIETPLSNLKLCGDYVYIEENNQPGLPSTLEGALRSGVKCAQLLLQPSSAE